jgi:hypothetical protein
MKYIAAALLYVFVVAVLARLVWGKPRQTTFCYCPNCRNELCADAKTKCYDAGSEVHYVCGKCNFQSDWDFGPPVPIYLRGRNEDE